MPKGDLKMNGKSTARSDIAPEYFSKLRELWDNTDLKFNPANKKDAMARAKRMLSYFARNILGLTTNQFVLTNVEGPANSSGQITLRTDILANGEKGVYICIEQIISGVNYSLTWGTVNHRKDVNTCDVQRSKVSNCFRDEQEILRFAHIVKNKCKVKNQTKEKL